MISSVLEGLWDLGGGRRVVVSPKATSGHLGRTPGRRCPEVGVGVVWRCFSSLRARRVGGESPKVSRPKGILAVVEGWVRGPGVDGAKGTSARHLGGPVLDRYRETCQKDGVFMDGRANGGEGRSHQGVSVS